MKKINTIKKYREFKEILDLKKSKRNDLYSIYFRPNTYGYTRIGILIGRRNGIAVTRNKIKRQIRSIIEQNFSYTCPVDIVITISKFYDVTTFEINKTKLIKLLTNLLGERNERKE